MLNILNQYLDSYVPKKQIGTKALSSVLVSLADSGNGLKVSTYNINYCTAGMYKNALATAGVEDANVIVAGPFPLSGTAALVGTFEAYEKLTGKELDESVVDAAMDELVTTGDLEQSIDGDSNDVEAMIAAIALLIVAHRAYLMFSPAIYMMFERRSCGHGWFGHLHRIAE